MKSQEGIDMVKMSIICLLLVLVIGAAIGLFYMLSDKTNDFTRSMNNASHSVNMDKMFELADMSSDVDKNYPTAATVAMTVQEFDGDDLLYLLVKYPTTKSDTGEVDNSNYKLFCYSGCAGANFGDKTVSASDCYTDPTVMCAKELLKSTDKYCLVTIKQYKADYTETTDRTEADFTALEFTVLEGATD